MSHDLLGKPIHEIKPTLTNAVAGVVLSILFFGAGAVLLIFMIKTLMETGGNLPLQAERGHSWFSVGLLSLIGIGLLLGSSVLFYYVMGLFTFRLCVCAGGFYTISRGKMQEFPWDEIKEVHETIQHEKIPIVKRPVKHLVPTKESRSYNIVRKDGVAIGFDRNKVPKQELIIKPLKIEMERRGVPWVVEEVNE